MNIEKISDIEKKIQSIEKTKKITKKPTEKDQNPIELMGTEKSIKIEVQDDSKSITFKEEKEDAESPALKEETKDDKSEKSQKKDEGPKPDEKEDENEEKKEEERVEEKAEGEEQKDEEVDSKEKDDLDKPKEEDEEKKSEEVSDGIHPLSREASPIRESQETIMRASPRTEAIQNLKDEIYKLQDWTEEKCMDEMHTFIETDNPHIYRKKIKGYVLPFNMKEKAF